MSRDLLDRAGVARKLGLSVKTIYHRLPVLQKREGFPPPVMGNGRGARWDPLAIDKWFDRRQGFDTHAANDTRPEDVDDWAEKLDARSDAMTR